MIQDYRSDMMLCTILLQPRHAVQTTSTGFLPTLGQVSAIYVKSHDARDQRAGTGTAENAGKVYLYSPLAWQRITSV